jgi:hypothetical protein
MVNETSADCCHNASKPLPNIKHAKMAFMGRNAKGGVWPDNFDGRLA